MGGARLDDTMRNGRHLVLEDGTVFTGRGFGHGRDIYGEVVFNTSMTGYVEVLTDPSYTQQIVVMCAPEIGTYGVCKHDVEAARIWAAGLVVRHLSARPSNWRSDIPLPAWMEAEQTPGLTGIDTRALVRRLRDRGTMRGALVAADQDLREVLDKIRHAPTMKGLSLVDEVSCKSAYAFTEGLLDLDGTPLPPLRAPTHSVVALDLGMKTSIARLLVHHGAKVTVVPHTESAADILARRPDGVFLSNGPGDPATQQDVVATVKDLVGKVPLFGICMGHQVLGQAVLDLPTYKTQFGHRGSNQPVLIDGERVWITAQNHGFALEPGAALSRATRVEVNVSDGTNEGFCLQDPPVLSVQYHPEAAPGPRDARPLFETFAAMMDAAKGATVESHQ